MICGFGRRRRAGLGVFFWAILLAWSLILVGCQFFDAAAQIAELRDFFVEMSRAGRPII
jgi:hypothetical protein